MQKVKIILPALLLLITHYAYAQSEKVISGTSIERVRIFLSGAQIDRSFKTSIEAGVSRLVVENLSSQIDANSIDVKLKGNAMVLSTSYTLDYLKEKKLSAQLKKLKDSLETLNTSLTELNMMEAVYNEEVNMLNANKNIGGSNVGINADNLKKVIDFYRTRMVELKTAIMDIDKKQLKLSEKISLINKQIEEENGRINTPSGSILIDVTSQQKEGIEIDLSYYTRGATWNPSYDIRALNTKSDVNLTYKAEVVQQTGENWDRVRVSLSSGNPTLSGNKPQLQPWFLSFYKPVIYKQQGLKRSVEQEPMSLDEVQIISARPRSPQVQMPDVVQMNENQLVTVFEIQIPYSVPSDGKTVTMDIQAINLPATFTYFTTPKMDQDAFLTASITGWERINLLPGPSKVYMENSYVGQSYINPSSAVDTLILSLGRDKRIVVKREKVKDMSSTKFIGGNVEKEFLFETTIRNTKKEDLSIVVEDQIPLSTDDALKISTGELSKGNYNAETGMIDWKLDLKPGETKKLRLGYKVKYPKEKIVQGL